MKTCFILEENESKEIAYYAGFCWGNIVEVTKDLKYAHKFKTKKKAQEINEKMQKMVLNIFTVNEIEL